MTLVLTICVSLLVGVVSNKIVITVDYYNKQTFVYTEQEVKEPFFVIKKQIQPPKNTQVWALFKYVFYPLRLPRIF